MIGDFSTLFIWELGARKKQTNGRTDKTNIISDLCESWSCDWLPFIPHSFFTRANQLFSQS